MCDAKKRACRHNVSANTHVGELSDVGDDGVGCPGDEKGCSNDEHDLEWLELLPGRVKMSA